MKRNFEELVEYIKNNTTPEFDDLLEKAKKDSKKIIIWFLVLAVIVNPVMLYIYYYYYSNIVYLPKIAIVFAIVIINLFLYIIISIAFSGNKTALVGAFKYSVIQKLLCNFYDNVNYSPKNMMPERIYEEPKYNEFYDIYRSDDYMEAKIDGKYDIKMAEIHTLKEETHTDSDGHTTTTETTKFHGIFSRIQMEKSINSNLLIMENHSFFKKDRLDMDSQEFEKLFDVSATNQIIGMQLLTHDIMELLISFKKQTGIEYDISIYNNIMYLRFHTGSMFEFRSFKKGAFDEKMLREYYDVLDFTCKLSKMLIDLIENTEI